MYISKIISICEKNGYTQIYSPSSNSTLMVKNSLYNKLKELYDKYKSDEIDEYDETYVNIKNKEEYDVLIKNRIICEDNEWLENKYRAFDPKLKIIYLHVTQECNLRCTYCYAKNNLGKDMMMNENASRKYIDILEQKGVKKVVLTGGEPLLNPDIEKIVEYIKKKGIYVSLLTNGTLLSKHMRMFYDIDDCIVSLDVEGSMQRKGISADRVFSELLSIPHDLRRKVSIRSVISKGEELQIEEMRNKVEKDGFHYIFIPRLPNCIEELRLFPNLDLIDEPKELMESMRMIRCGAATAELAIDWNGDIYPCQNLMRKEHRISNLNKSNWEEHLQTSNLRKTLREAHVLNIEKCKECDVRFICGSGCRAISYNMYETYYHCIDFYCEHFKKYAIDKLKKVRFSSFENMK